MESSKHRCPVCLRLTADNLGQCDDLCGREPAEKTNERAQLLLTMRGYRVDYGQVWVVTNEDAEGWWEGTTIAHHRGEGPVELFNLLAAHRFPTTPSLYCPQCHENDVAYLGDVCDTCRGENREWHRAESLIAEGRGK